MIGAILASAVFFVVVLTFKQFGEATPIELQKEFARGELIEIKTHAGQTRGIVIEGERSLTLLPEDKNRNYVIELNPGLVAGLLSAGVPAYRAIQKNRRKSLSPITSCAGSNITSFGSPGRSRTQSTTPAICRVTSFSGRGAWR